MRRGLAGISVLLAASAQAALGGAHASVEQDRGHFGARMTSTTTGVVHLATLQPANGGIIREYSNVDGTVFAVTWRGPARPDFRQLLGDRYAAASADIAAPTSSRRRVARLMTVERAELVIRSQGRPGAFSGVAYDPRLLPSGFALDDLR